MPNRFLIKDIAFQAGVGTATVDRVLNRRGNVRLQTVDRVHQAIVELEQQRKQLALTGRRLVADLIVEAPQNFLDALEEAMARELPLLRPAAFRVRRALRTHFPVPMMEELLLRALRRGSDGVILMGPDAEPLRAAVNRLESSGIPVITLATDLAGTMRTAYAGMDNRVAGRTAAWFLGKCLQQDPEPRVLATLRNVRFRGEEEREAGFREGLARHLPQAKLEIVVEGDRRPEFLDRVAEMASAAPFDAAYSIGGGNLGILETLERVGRPPRVFVAHDLDPENRTLFDSGRVDLLLYHDLSEDVRNAARVIMARHLSQDVPDPPQNAGLRILLAPMSGRSGVR